MAESNPLPEYEKPPVLEVVAGIQFAALTSIQTRHFGEFWAEVKGDYPVTQDMPPLLDINEPLQMLQLPPLRRVFLLSSDQQYVVQLQDTRLNLNWRKVQPGVKYPRFNAVFGKFQRVWKAFSDFSELASLGKIVPIRYELTYVNHIETEDRDFSRELEAKVKMFRWKELSSEFLPAPTSVSEAWQFEMPEGKGVLNANLSHAKRLGTTDLLVLNMVCAGPASSSYTLQDWFETAHEWVVRGFTELTTEEAHKKWGRTS